MTKEGYYLPTTTQEEKDFAIVAFSGYRSFTGSSAENIIQSYEGQAIVLQCNHLFFSRDLEETMYKRNLYMECEGKDYTHLAQLIAVKRELNSEELI